VRLYSIAILLSVAATPGSAAQTPSNALAAPPAPAADIGADGHVGTPVQGAAQQDFTLVNKSGHTVITLNVSPASEASWGKNVLGHDRLPSGESAQITFPRNTIPCDWDIKATYEDGTNTDLRNVDLCEVATVTLTAS
jgi:hypothetical protein